MTKRSLIAPAIKLRPEQLELLAGVAVKALDMGKGSEAERLLASAVNDFDELAQHASTLDEWETVARMHATLEPILPRLEAATGRPWTRCLEIVQQRAWKPRLPPRGEA